jgi:hypothetical protein
MEPAYKGREFDALKIRYEDQVALLRSLTQNELKLVSGFVTMQLVLGGWLSAHPTGSMVQNVGLLIIDLVLAGGVAKILHHSYRRRGEVIATVLNLNEALGYSVKGAYIDNKTINPSPAIRSWFGTFLVSIAAGVIGFALILFGSQGKPMTEQERLTKEKQEFKQLDTDGDGKLTFEEYLAGKKSG